MLLWFPHPAPALNPVFLQPKDYEESTGTGISRRAPGLWPVPACHDDILQVTSERQLAAKEETACTSPSSQEGSEKLR